MQIESKQINLDSRWFSPERDTAFRSDGVHLSHVIDYIEWQEAKREKPSDVFSKSGHAYAASGFLWERILERLIERDPTELWEWLYGRVLADVNNPKIVRPGEQQLDAGECPACAGTGRVDYNEAVFYPHGEICKWCSGSGRLRVYLTPDGYHIDDALLEEWKWTTKSSANDIHGPKFHRWIQLQIPAYLKSLLLTRCRLRVYHARGNYQNPEPIWMEHIIEYRQQEIDETWDMLANNAQAMVRERLAA